MTISSETASPQGSLMNDKLVILMCGLPGRGKSYLTTKLAHYLNWTGFKSKCFHAGEYRRRLFKDQDVSKFSTLSDELNNTFEISAMAALDDLLEWLRAPKSNVGIHDAVNLMQSFRKKLVDRIKLEKGVKVIIIESIFDNQSLIEEHINMKLLSPDYTKLNGQDNEKSQLFKDRIKEFAKFYQPVQDEENIPYIKLLNVSEKITVSKINGYLTSQILFYLMNIHVCPRTIYMTRHGQSEYNIDERIGGDSDLSEKGRAYSKRLAEWFKANIIQKNGDEQFNLCEDDDITQDGIQVWTSCLKRTIETASSLGVQTKEFPALNEIQAGICDGMTYHDIERDMPAVHIARGKDKLGFRYPGGESYLDLVQRLKPVIYEIERRKHNILIVGHQAILRTLLGYFLDIELSELPFIEVPLDTVFKLTPTPFGCTREIISFKQTK